MNGEYIYKSNYGLFKKYLSIDNKVEIQIKAARFGENESWICGLYSYLKKNNTTDDEYQIELLKRQMNVDAYGKTYYEDVIYINRI